jgi:hypothetical protein
MSINKKTRKTPHFRKANRLYMQAYRRKRKFWFSDENIKMLKKMSRETGMPFEKDQIIDMQEAKKYMSALKHYKEGRMSYECVESIKYKSAERHKQIIIKLAEMHKEYYKDPNNVMKYRYNQILGELLSAKAKELIDQKRIKHRRLVIAVDYYDDMKKKALELLKKELKDKSIADITPEPLEYKLYPKLFVENRSL